MRVGMEWLISRKWLSCGDCADSDITNPKVVVLEKFFRVPMPRWKFACLDTYTNSMYCSCRTELHASCQCYSKNEDVWDDILNVNNGQCRGLTVAQWLCQSERIPWRYSLTRPRWSQHASNHPISLISWVVATTTEREPRYGIKKNQHSHHFRFFFSSLYQNIIPFKMF